jgi:hypothetical protein
MAQAELNRLEGEVREARQRLKSDLEVLRAPDTFSTFKDELVTEARASGDDAIANAKSAATDWSDRLIAEIKERAAANPVAVGAIAAGIGWRILRKPPITTMLVGFGLYSLYRTKPGELAPGAERVYQAADLAVAAKEQIQQWSNEAGDAAGQVREALAPTVRQLSEDAGEAVAKATDSVRELATTGSEQVRRWRDNAGTAVAQVSDIAQTMGARGSQSLQHLATDQRQRDKLLLGIASLALTTALGLRWLRRT